MHGRLEAQEERLIPGVGWAVMEAYTARQQPDVVARGVRVVVVFGNVATIDPAASDIRRPGEIAAADLIRVEDDFAKSGRRTVAIGGVTHVTDAALQFE